MSFLAQLFFERPILLGIFAFLLFAVILFVRTRFESARARRYSLPGVLLAIALLFVLQKVVVTERERIFASCDGFVGAIERRDPEAAAEYISESF